MSKEFAQAVWKTAGLTMCSRSMPELCERLARSLGTRPRLNTIQQPGAMSTVAATGVMSTRAVESLRLHPIG